MIICQCIYGFCEERRWVLVGECGGVVSHFYFNEIYSPQRTSFKYSSYIDHNKLRCKLKPTSSPCIPLWSFGVLFNSPAAYFFCSNEKRNHRYLMEAVYIVLSWHFTFLVFFQVNYQSVSFNLSSEIVYTNLLVYWRSLCNNLCL